MDEVAEAVDADVPPLQHSVVIPEQHLVVSGVADEGEPVLASDPALTDLLDDGTATAYLRTDCIPINDALGPDATPQDQARSAEHTSELQSIMRISYAVLCLTK